MKKLYSTIKVGYTAGMYGNSGEQFVTVFTDKNGGLSSFRFDGQYGVEERINKAMDAKGYKKFYCGSFPGKFTRAEVKNFWSEYTALNFINEANFSYEKLENLYTKKTKK